MSVLSASIPCSRCRHNVPAGLLWRVSSPERRFQRMGRIYYCARCGYKRLLYRKAGSKP
jgi:hypothetical protein